MKLRSPTIAIAIGAIAVSIVCLSAYGWISAHRSLLLLQRTVTTPPATAGFVPKTAPAVFSFVANLDDLANLDLLATPTPQRQQTNRQIEQWQQQISNRLHLDYQREIAPWLGEDLTVAISMERTLKAIDRQSLLDSDRYHRATPLLTATTTGYLYDNWQTIEPLLPKQLRDRSVVKSVGKSLLAGLPNISISHYLEAGIQRITLLFQVDR
jgi:Protein of unknown function (DUF3352)